MTYQETFEILSQARLIPYELAEELSGLTGYIDAFIHICWQLDLDLVYGVLQNDLETLKFNLLAVKRLLDKDLLIE
jgi:uncharacterized protein YutE (UPF0331/DUF86 family)